MFLSRRCNKTEGTGKACHCINSHTSIKRLTPDTLTMVEQFAYLALYLTQDENQTQSCLLECH